jgi:CheY-like chemotaxis protein
VTERPTGPTSAEPGSRPKVARVLVIDDEVRVAAALSRMLSDEFDVRSTTRPAEALQWLTGGDWYDVILCDVMMPNMTGVELHQRLQATHPDLAARIVFVSGGSLSEPIRSYLDSTPNTVLSKPFDLASLRELIRRRARVQSAPSRSSQA